MVDDGCKAGWSIESDGVPGLVIGIQDTLSSGTEGIISFHVQEELMGEVRAWRHPRKQKTKNLFTILEKFMS